MIYKIQKVTPLEDILILQRVAEMEQERYSKSGDYSVTDLVNPPRVVHLKKRHGHKVTPRLDTSISSMMGTGMHEYFEKYLDLWCDKYNYDGYSLEEQVEVSWNTMIDGEIETRLISGRYDIREGKDLYDLKTAKVWKLIFDPNLEEYHEQQNFYSHLIKIDKDISLDTVNIVALYKDWQEGNALRDRNYPQQQMMQYQLTKWPDKETKKLISLRLKRLVENENVKDEDLPLCSRDERWERHQGGETVHYAILKNRKAKRATKVVRGGTLDDALVIANGMKGMTKDSVIEVRYAFPKRCAKYCDTNEFCSFWKEWNEKNEKGMVNDYFTFKV